MAKNSAARRWEDLPPVPELKRVGSGGGGPPQPPVRPSVPLGSNAWVATIMLLGAETMFFAGLVGAFLVFRIGSPVWPPPFQPRLPVEVTAINTLVLVASAFMIVRAMRANRRAERNRVARMLFGTALLGTAFLLIQGFEWIRLIHFGLTASSSVYGGLFYTLIGFHALHVFGALVWLAVVWLKIGADPAREKNKILLQTCGMYWIFVVALWPVLYGLVYLY